MDKNKNDSAEGARPEGGRAFQPLRIAVLTVSDSRDQSSDRSGKLLAESLRAAGHRLHEKRIVPDEPARVRESSCAATMRSQAVRQAPGEPGRQKI